MKIPSKVTLGVAWAITWRMFGIGVLLMVVDYFVSPLLEISRRMDGPGEGVVRELGVILLGVGVYLGLVYRAVVAVLSKTFSGWQFTQVEPEAPALPNTE